MHILCLQTFPIDYSCDFVNAVATQSRVTFVGSDSDIARVGQDVDPSVGVIPVPWPRHRSIANLGLVRRILGVIRDTKPDLVHFMGDGTIWLNLLPPLMPRLPRVVTVHDVVLHPGDSQSRRVPWLAIQQLRRAASTIVVHGERQRQTAIQSMGRPAEEIQVVPHVVLERYARIAARRGLKRHPGTPPTVLFFGRLMAYKGLPVLVEAAKAVRLALPGARFVVAGTGPEQAWLRERVGTDPGFELIQRYVDDDETAQLFLDADIVVLPYIEASQSGVLALAAALGRPAVVTDVGDIGAVVQDNAMGLVVPPGSPDALAQALLAIFQDSSLAERLRAGSAAAARGGISYGRVGADMARIYRATLARHERKMAA